jgi:hypothetical protein
MIFNESQKAAVEYVAAQLGIKSLWLIDLIQFESSWNPQAKNKITGARGLIQFMPATAAAMGFSGYRSIRDGSPTAADNLVATAPTIETQMKYVLQYLKPLAPFPTLQSLHMAVFYPRYRSVAPTTEFPDTVKKANPGIKTVSDYMRRASPLARVAAPMLLCAIGAAAFFL